MIKLTNNWEGRNYVKQSKAMRWFHFKQKVRNFFKQVIKWMVIIAILAGIIQYFRWAYPMTVVNVRETITQVDTLTPKINELKDEVLDLLKECESGGASEETGLVVFDSNKVASLGQYQFQKATVVAYYKKLYNKDITGKEALMIALDSDQARKLASDIIFTTTNDKGVNNWYNCTKKQGLESKVAFINKISK